MSKQEFDIWGRTLDLDIVYDFYDGEEILSSQQTAFQAFCEKSALIFETAKTQVQEYCLKINGNDIGSDCIDNIFKYVKPKALYIKRTTDCERIVAIICAYKFNPDDGIAIVFKNEQFSAIGTENIIL